MINKKESQGIYVFKAIALYLVICVHCCTFSGNTNIGQELKNFMSVIGLAGVTGFFFMSGYLYNNNIEIKDFLIKRIVKIGLPWITAGVYLWLFYSITGNLEISGLFKYLFTQNSPLWYLVVLVCLWMIFFWVKRNRTIVLIILGGGNNSRGYNLFIPQ